MWFNAVGVKVIVMRGGIAWVDWLGSWIVEVDGCGVEVGGGGVGRGGVQGGSVVGTVGSVCMGNWGVCSSSSSDSVVLKLCFLFFLM